MCDVSFHWAKDCPHRQREQLRLTEDVHLEEVNITLLAKSPRYEAETYLTELLQSAIINTAYTHTVCAEKWLDSY